MPNAIAIDFGTSRTKLAYLDGQRGRAELMRLGLYDQPFMPSLFYLERDGERILMGDDAEEMLGEDPAGVVDLLKRKLHDTYVRANRRRVPPAELLAALLGHLAERARSEVAALQRQLPGVVYLTVPAVYGPMEERVLQEAGQQAGLGEVILVPEPVAAARAWLAETEDTHDDVVVLDCGGGTIDWAYLRRAGDDFRLVAECPPSGDRVGGHDVDRELLDRINELLEWSAEDELRARELHYLRAVRALKERYCRGLPLSPLRVAGHEAKLTAGIIQGVIAERFIAHACEGLKGYLTSLRAAGGPEEPLVLLVGGSARLKGLREAVEQACGCKTTWWERSEYATALGALPTTPSPKPAPLPTASPAPTPAVLPSPQDIQGWSTEKVQSLQRQVAEALGKAVALRDRLHGGGQGPEMLVIPPGRCLMGSPQSEPGHQGDEGPQHAVTVTKPFALARYALTFTEYDAYCETTGKEKPSDRGWGRGKRPVINVSWDDAVAYCRWLSEQTGAEYGLPSEGQWEYACRAGTSTPFWWGSAITTKQGNYDGNYPYNNGPKGEYRARTVSVDEFEPNPWGLYQMHGNVWEWVKDWYADYSKDSQEDPIVDTGGSVRVFRGGSWNFFARYLRAAYRYRGEPGGRNGSLGFRPARTL